MDSMEKLALKRLGWSVAGLGMFGVARAVRNRYGVGSGGRVPFPVAFGVAGVSALVRHQVEAAARAYQYEKGRADGAEAVAGLDRSVSEALREAMAEDDGTRIPMVEVNRYIRDVADGDFPIDDQVKAAVWSVLRRQESKTAHPSSTRVIEAAGKTTEQVIAEAKAAMGDGEWIPKSVTPSKPKHLSNEGK